MHKTPDAFYPHPRKKGVKDQKKLGEEKKGQGWGRGLDLISRTSDYAMLRPIKRVG